MALPQTLSTTVTAGIGVAVGPKQSGGMAIIGPLDASATVAADVVKPYTSPPAVATDHFSGSTIHEASKAAFGAKARPIFIGGFSDVTLPAIGTRTFGDASAIDTGTLPSALLPLYDAGAVTIDGVAYDTIIYTSQVPNATNFPSLGDGTGATDLELVVNPKTGVFLSGLTTTGSGAGIVFASPKSPDWAKLREIIAGKPVDIVYLAGWENKPQYWAVWDSHATWANGPTVRMRAAAALPDGIGSTGDGTAGGLDTFNDHTDGDTVAELVGAMPHDNLHLTAWHKSTSFPSGFDIGAAFAAGIAGLGQSGSTALKPVPDSIRTYIDTLEVFTPSEYGALVDPATDTLHEVGVNSIVLDTANQPKWSALRSTKAYVTDAFNFNDFDTRGRINRVNNVFQGIVNTWIAGAPQSGLFDDDHLARLRDRLITASGDLKREGTIVKPVADADIFIPTRADTLAADRAKNTLDGAFVNVALGKVVLQVNLELGVGF